MNTQTHLLVAAALFAEPDQPKRNAAALAGAIVPDIAIYGLWVWSKLSGIPERTVWDELYWQQPWQSYTALGNSMPLYVVLLVIGVLVLRQPQAAIPAPASGTFGERWRARVARQTPLTIFALAALTHLAGDFPVHVDDAHPHLWPLTDWRFRSPVSYWNPDHYGTWFSLLEIVVGLALCVIVFRRFRAIWVRAMVVFAMTAYVAVPAYFIFVIAHH